MNDPHICKHCNKPMMIVYADEFTEEVVYECTCINSHYANMSYADHWADAEYEDYIKSLKDKEPDDDDDQKAFMDSFTEEDYWDGDETDKIQY